MRFLGKISVLLAILFTLSFAATATAQSRGKVLVVMSGGHLLNLKEGKVYATGYYAGYKLSVFSKTEEKQIEIPQLDGYIQAYNDEALASAGATITNAAPWQPNVVQDREVITAQQPFSDHAFADAFLAKLNAQAH